MRNGQRREVSVSDVIREHASSLRETTALMFLTGSNSEPDPDTMTYGELDGRAAALAAWLQDRFAKNDRILLLYPSGLEFAVAFLGCLYGGMVAVPAPLPGGYKGHAERLARIAHDADCVAILTDSKNLAEVSSWASETGLERLERSAVQDAELDAGTWTLSSSAPDTLALLQYTSGSTSDPKGVMVSHDNLLHNAMVYRQSLGFDTSIRIGGWAPLYHDMGLIAQLLPALLFGSSCVFMSPTTFVRRPYSWLQMIDEYDVGLSLAPNFAFDLCARQVTDQQIAELDLSRWEVAVNGAEPIHASTLTAFTSRFAPAGFNPQALRPCYGMAEATVYVCGSTSRRPLVRDVDAGLLEAGVFQPSAPGPGTRTLVSCGRPVDFEMQIIDPLTREERADGRVGEIWLRGKSVTKGYWRKQQATAEVFNGVTTGLDAGYLRTGDLGVLYEGELFVTGRIKEVLVVRGRNLYPQDLELVIRALRPELADGLGAVFNIPLPGREYREEVVVLHEVRGRPEPDELATITADIRLCLVREFGVAVVGVVLLRRGGIQRTTSGKIQRLAMREHFLHENLSPLYEDLDSEVRQLFRRPGPLMPGASAVAAPTGKEES